MKPFLISILFSLSITDYSLASTDFLEKFNGKFKCSTNNQEIPTCLYINTETNTVDMNGCGFASKEFEIIQTQTKLTRLHHLIITKYPQLRIATDEEIEVFNVYLRVI